MECFWRRIIIMIIASLHGNVLIAEELSVKRKKIVFINPWYSYTLLHCYYDILYMCCTQKKLGGDFFR
jgi:hypothetical protein